VKKEQFRSGGAMEYRGVTATEPNACCKANLSGQREKEVTKNAGLQKTLGKGRPNTA